MLLTEFVEISPKGKSLRHYRDLGYTENDNGVIRIKTEDLPYRSRATITILCDYCKENTKEMQYASYVAGRNVIQKDACNNCVGLKRKESNMLVYGYECTSQLPEIKEKVKQSNLERFGMEYYSQTQEWLDRKKNTSLEKYGCECNLQSEETKKAIRDTNLKKYGFEYATQSQVVKDRTRATVQEKYGANSILEVPEIRNKIFETNLSKYGYKYSIQSEEVRNKVKETNMRNLGVEYPMQSKEIRDKKEKTCLERYNVSTPFALKEIREKAINTMYKKGNVQCSIQQLYIYRLYNKYNDNVALNYPIGKNFFADICFLDEKIVVEYDGKGHNLSVVLGNITQEEFDKKEIVRNNVVKHEGYKQIRIVSQDIIKLPSDPILLQMLTDARTYFSQYPNHSWFEFNLDTSTIRNAENPQGIPYSFGPLRIIKENDLQDFASAI